MIKSPINTQPHLRIDSVGRLVDRQAHLRIDNVGWLVGRQHHFRIDNVTDFKKSVTLLRVGGTYMQNFGPLASTVLKLNSFVVILT